MKNGFRTLELTVLLAVGCCFLLLPQTTVRGAAVGLNICATAILPTLFPFFALTDYWVRSGYAASMARLAAPLMRRLFHLPGEAAAALVLGSIGGYPVGARTAAQLYAQKQLRAEEAEQVLLFCNNGGPAFVLGILGSGVFQSAAAGTALYLIHLAGAFLVGLLFRPSKKPEAGVPPTAEAPKDSSAQRWTQAIGSAGGTAVQVCTFVLFFAILTQCIRSLIPSALQNSRFFTIFSGLLELAGGAKALASGPWPRELQFVLAAFLLGWGGLCVMLQSLSVLQAAGLSGKKLLWGKACHGAVSAILAALLAPALPLPRPCGMTVRPIGLLILQQSALIMLLGLFFWLFLKESSGKAEKNRI